MGLTIEWRGHRRKLSEAEDETIHIIQYEHHRENKLKKKMSRASGTYGTIIEDLALMSLESQKESKKKVELEKCMKN